MPQHPLWVRVCAVPLAVLILCSSCIDTSGLRDLAALQSDIAEEFKERTVSVNLNNSVYLAVTFENSSRAELPADARAAFAREVAGFVRDHYPGYTELEMISIGFTIRRGVGPVSITRSNISCRFSPADLLPALDSTAVVEQDGGDRVTLKSADRCHGLTYSCDHFEPAAKSAAEERIIRNHSLRIAQQVGQQVDRETLEQLVAAYESNNLEWLEKVLVDYVCQHGVVGEEIRVP
jgi:hypothetical protein